MGVLREPTNLVAVCAACAALLVFVIQPMRSLFSGVVIAAGGEGGGAPEPVPLSGPCTAHF